MAQVCSPASFLPCLSHVSSLPPTISLSQSPPSLFSSTSFPMRYGSRLTERRDAFAELVQSS